MSPFGATITRLLVSDKDGKMEGAHSFRAHSSCRIRPTETPLILRQRPPARSSCAYIANAMSLVSEIAPR